MPTCTHCQASFSVTDEDRRFLADLSPVIPSSSLQTGSGKRYDLPPPTLCPDCRLQRRLTHRNERTLYKRPCAKTGKEIISVYAPESLLIVYEVSEWWGDSWDALNYRKDVDWNRPIFEQVAQLQKVVPRMSLLQLQNENSLYTNCVSNLKDCYLISSSDYNRNCYYGSWIERSNDCTDNFLIEHCERTYEAVFSDQLHTCQFAVFSRNCSDCAFIFDCQGCHDCILCWNLRNKQYCIENEQLSKENYEQRKREMLNGTWSSQRALLKQLEETMKTKAIHLSMWRTGRIVHSTGDWLCNVENCIECFEVKSAKDCHYASSVYEIKDAMDCNYASAELGYENCECFPMPFQSAFNLNCYGGSNLYYCDMCMNNCNNCFGCVGLKHAEYCILNKKCSKEEYENLVPKLIEHMIKAGEWGQFFPTTTSPYAYNETNAQDYFPLSKEDIEKRNWRWREPEDDVGTVERTIPAEKLPDAIGAIPDDVLNWAITCSVTKRPFKVIKQELEFYRSMSLPVPRMHPEERHRRKQHYRNPRKLWDRTCAKCSKEIQTTYQPTRPEIVYCEQCYLKAVY